MRRCDWNGGERMQDLRMSLPTIGTREQSPTEAESWRNALPSHDCAVGYCFVPAKGTGMEQLRDLSPFLSLMTHGGFSWTLVHGPRAGERSWDAASGLSNWWSLDQHNFKICKMEKIRSRYAKLTGSHAKNPIFLSFLPPCHQSIPTPNASRFSRNRRRRLADTRMANPQ